MVLRPSVPSKTSRLRNFFFKNRDTNQTVIKNTFWAFVAEGVKKGVLLLLSILIARYLGVSGYGQFSFALSFTMLFSVLADLGLNMLSTREIAREPAHVHKYISTIATLKILLGLGTFAVIFSIAQWINKPDQIKTLIYLFSGYIILNSINDFFVSVFRAHEEIEYEALFKIIQSAALLLITSLLLFLHCSALWLVSGYLGSRLIGLAAILIILAKKRIPVHLDFDPAFAGELLKESWPFALSTVFYIIYFSIDSIMISFLLGDREVGIYSASYTLMSGLFYIPFLISIPFFPRMSKLLKGTNEQIKGLVSMWNRNLIITFIPIFLLSFVFAKYIILLLYGPLYDESIYVFKLLLFALPFKFLSHPPGYSLSALNLHRRRVAIQGFTALFNTVTNYVFIPIYGINAACVTTLLSCFLLFALYQFFFNRLLATRSTQ